MSRTRHDERKRDKYAAEHHEQRAARRYQRFDRANTLRREITQAIEDIAMREGLLP